MAGHDPRNIAARTRPLGIEVADRQFDLVGAQRAVEYVAQSAQIGPAEGHDPRDRLTRAVARAAGSISRENLVSEALPGVFLGNWQAGEQFKLGA